jgi:hypothetical protein
VTDLRIARIHLRKGKYRAEKGKWIWNVTRKENQNALSSYISDDDGDVGIVGY